MRSRQRVVAVFFLFLSMVTGVRAEVVTLVSGEKVQGPVIERHADSIVVDFMGTPLTFYNSEITSIEPDPVAPEPVEQAPVQDVINADIGSQVAELAEIFHIKDLFVVLRESAMAEVVAGQNMRSMGNAKDMQKTQAKAAALSGAIRDVYDTSLLFEQWMQLMRKSVEVSRLADIIERSQDEVIGRLLGRDYEKPYPEMAADFAAFMTKASFEPPDPQRLELARAFEQATQAAEQSADLQTIIAFEMLKGAAHSLPEGHPKRGAWSEEQALADLPMMHAALKEQAMPRMVLWFVYIYRNDSLEDQKRLLDLLSSENGQWMQMTMRGVMKDILQETGAALGVRIAREAVKQQ